MEDFFEWNLNKNTPKIKKKPWMEKKSMALVTKETLSKVIDDCIASGLIALDIECTGLNKNTFEIEFGKGRTQDQIVGFCISPDGQHGYYIPIRHQKGTQHNLPLSMVENELRRLVRSKCRFIFHNHFFDCEFLQFNGGEPLGEWDDPEKFEDTFILAYLLNSKSDSLGLKALSKDFLNQEMIELKELFPIDQNGNLDFSELDPSWEPVILYACSDALCTYDLFHVLYPKVIEPDGNRGRGQSIVYKIEKMCAPATRWIERVGLPIDTDMVVELIQLGQKEYFDAIQEVYSFCNRTLSRDIEPPWFKHLRENINVLNVENNFSDQIDLSKTLTKRSVEKASFRKIIKGQEKEFPGHYDILSRQQLGPLLEELEIPDLHYTEKSGQVKTTQDEIDRLNEKHGKSYTFLPLISRMGELQKALGSYLYPIYKDLGPDGRLHCRFKQLGTDTGRFATAKGDPSIGGTTLSAHGIPSTADKSKPKCLLGLRKTIKARTGKMIVAIDYASVELRIVTNLSGEPLWLTEYFRCNDCDTEFERNHNVPKICPKCGSDKIGDIHSLTAISFYGQDKVGTPEWKALRGYGKVSNFALAYGGGPAALQRATGCNENDAAHFHRIFNQKYETLKSWWDYTVEFAEKNEYVLSAFKRHYPVPDINLPVLPKGEPDPEKRRLNKVFRSKAKRNAINAPIQMTSADITKLAMGLIFKELKARGWLDKVTMLLTMHDELVFEVDIDILGEFCDIIPKLMAKNPAILHLNWTVPILTDCEIGYDWSVPFNIIDWETNRVREDGAILDEKGRVATDKTGTPLTPWPLELVRALSPKYGAVPLEDPPTFVEIFLKDTQESTIKLLSEALKNNIKEGGVLVSIHDPSGDCIYEPSKKIDWLSLRHDLTISSIMERYVTKV